MSAGDRKIEQDIVFRLLHHYGAPTDVYKDTTVRQADSHPWYEFGGSMFTSAGGMRAVPSMFVSALATVMTIAVSVMMAF